MKNKILLAEPDPDRLKVLTNFITGLSFDVTAVGTGKETQLGLYQTSFKMMVLNLELQSHSGVEVFKYAKSKFPDLKIILIIKDEQALAATGLQRKILEKQGIIDILYLPIDNSKLKRALEGVQDINQLINKSASQGSSREVRVEADDNQFIALKLDKFVSGKTVLFDIFIRLGPGHYTKILHADDSFSKERIDKYRNQKNIESLFIRIEDHNKYLRFENYLSEKMVGSDKVSAASKVNLLSSVSEHLIEEVDLQGFRPQVIEESKKFCKSMYKMIKGNDGLKDLLSEYENFNADAYSHNFLVCLFSSLMAKNYAWNAEGMIENLGMAAIFHDIGMLKLPPSLQTRKVVDMNKLELDLYYQHPILGVEMMEENSAIPPIVKQVVLQHHEKCDGSGFPNKLSGGKITALSSMLSLADDFTTLMVESKLNPPETLKKILKTPKCQERYGLKFLQCFVNTFK